MLRVCDFLFHHDMSCHLERSESSQSELTRSRRTPARCEASMPLQGIRTVHLRSARESAYAARCTAIPDLAECRIFMNCHAENCHAERSEAPMQSACGGKFNGQTDLTIRPRNAATISPRRMTSGKCCQWVLDAARETSSGSSQPPAFDSLTPRAGTRQKRIL